MNGGGEAVTEGGQPVSRSRCWSRSGFLIALACIVIPFLSETASAATKLPATIKEDMTLTAAGNPYTGSPTIESGVTLKAEPGVQFKVGKMIVKGTLRTEGTAESPVVFTSAAGTPKAGDWQGINFESGSGSSVLDHAEVAYGGSAVNSGAIEIKNASPTITHSTIRNSKYYGIKVYGGAPNIGNSSILNNAGIGIYYSTEGAESQGINFHDNLLEGNSGSATVFIGTMAGTVGTSLGGNTITKNGSTQAIYYNGGTKREIPPDIANNAVSGNTGGKASNQVAFSGVLAKSATWEAPTAPLYIESELKIESGVSLTLKPGVTIHGGSIEVLGTLKAEGEASKPVVFESASEVSYGGNLKFMPGSSSSSLDFVETYRWGDAVNSGAIEIKNASPTITHSTIRNSKYYGIKIYGGAPNIGSNSILNNPSIPVYYSTEGAESQGINFHDNLLEGNGGSAAVFVGTMAGTVATSLGGNTITKNGSTQAIYYNGGTKNEVPIDIANNAVSGNTGGKASNQVAFSGVFTKSGTWESPTAPLYLEGTLKIPSEVTLTVKPGVTIHGGSVEVFGTLKTEGEASKPVTFESASEASYGGNIKFMPGSGASIIDNTIIYRYGNTTNSGAIEINNTSPTITHSSILNSKYYGIKVYGGAPNIGNNSILNNPSIPVYYSTEGAESQGINFHDNLLAGNGGSAAVFVGTMAGTVATSLGGNTITKNGSTQAIYYNGGTKREIPPDIANNTVGENTGGKASNQVAFSGVLAKSATWEAPTAPLYIESELKIESGVSLTLKPGVTIHGGSIEVLGTLKAEGEASKPVVFESFTESNWCGGIKFMPGSGASSLDYVETYRCGSATNSGAIEVSSASPTIKHSAILSSRYYGIKVTESGSPTIERNRFKANANGLSYAGTGKLSARNNDWGCSSGPKPSGCGDSVTSNVDWKPAAELPGLGARCRGKDSQCGTGADPVSLATGALDYSHRDLLLTNKSKEPLEFTRSYSSASSVDTGLGPGWAQTGLSSVSEQESGEALIVRPDGRQDVFTKTESGYTAPSGVTDKLEKVEGTFKLTTLQNTVYAYDSSGRIASITDDHGLKTTYAYSSEGRLATITDPSAQTLTFSYNASNHITAVKDSTGREVKYAYSAAGDLESVTDALGGVTKYAYDAAHRMTSITDPKGNVILKNVYDGQGRINEQEDGLKDLWKLSYSEGQTIVTEPQGGKLTYGFDGQDRVVSETDQLGHKTSTAYDAAGNVKEVVQPGGAKWIYGHDAAGNLTSVKDPEGGEGKYEYDAQNRLTAYTDARGGTWKYEWSKANDLTKLTDPEGRETTLAYNESGQPLSLTDPAKHKTEFSYDSRGNRLSVTDPLSHKTSYEYNSRNYLTAETLPGLKAETFERNALGDLLARTTPEGNKTKYAYDANGLPTQVTDPAEGVWKIAYNAMERPTSYTDPEEGKTEISYNGDLKPTKVLNRRGKATTYGYDAANQLTEVDCPEEEDWAYGYDARGNRSSAIDPDGNETTYGYDLLNRMTEVAEPLEVTSKYGYDPNGDLTSATNPRGYATAYAYDKLGRLTEVAQPLEETTEYAYDAAGNPASKTTAAGTLEYEHDAANRLTAIISGKSTLRSYGYDSANRRTSATDAEGHKIEIGYDNDSRPISIKDGRGQSITSTFNSRGLLTKQEDGRGTLKYEYDKQGRMSMLTDPQGKALSFSYDPEGDLSEVKRPNGVTTTNVFNDAGRLAETTSKAESGTVLEALQYAYDPAGNVTSRLDARVEAETTYAYDALNRLTEFNPPGEGATAYGYDKAGDRTNAGSVTYEYNALNQLTKASDGTTYSYDKAGRLTSEEGEADKTTYEWDPFDHLAKAEGPFGATSYAYDGLERLSERKAGTATQVFHYGNLSDRPTYETDAEGKTTTSYVAGPTGLLEQRSSEATSFPISDAHGDVAAIAGSTGTIESRQEYGPWGELLSGPSLEMGYLGAYERPTDPSTGLIQMGARSYSPALGAFTSEDPVLGHVGIGISANRYPYVWDNPLNRYDLNGRDVCVPTPFGNACAGDAAEGIGGAAKDEAEGAWNATAPARHWIGDRARDFAKQIHISTEELVGNIAGILGSEALCGIAGIGASVVGTPAAGVAAVALCASLTAIGVAEVYRDIRDEDEGLWTDELY